MTCLQSGFDMDVLGEALDRLMEEEEAERERWAKEYVDDEGYWMSLLAAEQDTEGE